MVTEDSLSLFDLTGRVAIVTGGNTGIGFGIASGLARAGCAVVVAGRRAEVNRAAADALIQAGGTAAGIEADVSDEAACQALIDGAVDRFGRLDVLVNNAGTAVRKQPQDYTLDEWRQVIDVNLTSAFLCSRAAYPHFVSAGGGKVISIGSIFSVMAASFAPAYAASKGGIVQLTKALACAWAERNIQANAILPGWIDTEFTKTAREQVPGLNERVLGRAPAGRWGTPDDFAGVSVFLASQASNFVTGAAIPVDGGYLSQG